MFVTTFCDVISVNHCVNLYINYYSRKSDIKDKLFFGITFIYISSRKFNICFFSQQCFQYPNFFRVVLTVPTEKVTEACERIRVFCEKHFRATGNRANGCDYDIGKVININGHSRDELYEIEK